MKLLIPPFHLTLLILLMSMSPFSIAVECSAVFPTGAQSHTSNGRLTVNANSYIYNTTSPVLPFKHETINSNKGDSCVSADCSASGAPAEAVNLASFPSFSAGPSLSYSNTTIGEGNNNTNTFGWVTIKKGGDVNFSANYDEYYFKGLTVDGKGVLNMRPGIYWVEQLNLNSGQTKINVVGNGTVYIYVKNSVNVNSNAEINGISDNAVLNLNVLGDINLNSNSKLSGLVYSNGTTTVNSQASFTGSISTGNLTLNSNATVTHQPGIIDSYDFSNLCTTSAPELMFHLEFDQGSGQTAFDTSGYGRNATLGGSNTENDQDPTWLCEADSFYMDFDKSKNQRLTTSSFTPPSTGVVAFWMKIPSIPNSLNRIFGFGDGFEIRFNAGGIMYIDINKTGSNNSIRTSGAFTTTDTWTHFAFTTDVTTGDWAVYINGALDNNGNETLTAQPSATLTIGGSTWKPNSNSLNGSLDDFRIYSGLLNQQEIAVLATTPPQPCVQVHHYDISHPNQALTCSAASIEIKACKDAACTLNSTVTSLDFSADNVIQSSHSFTGSESFSYANTTAETVTLSVTNTSETPTNNLTCNGSSAAEACDLVFVNAGFEFFGQNIGDPVPDQLAESNWQNVNFRAVEINTTTGACQAALSGTTDITFGFDCQSPSACLTGLAGINVSGDGNGEFSKTMSLLFDSNGIAALTAVNYADAGRLTLSAESINNPKVLKGSGQIDIYPSYLKLETSNANLVYSGVADTDIYTSGLTFNYKIGAYGAGNNLLPNYQPENLKLQVIRDYPTVSGTLDGDFNYKTSATIKSATGNPAFTSTSSLTFLGGEYSYSNAFYSETGRITLDVQDSSYLGNTISSQQNLSLGTFIPAYYDVSFETGVALDNTYINASAANFTYIGQAITFVKEPTFTIVPKNALDITTQNYLYADWTYAPALAAIMNTSKLSYADTSGYIGTASVAHTNSPLITNDYSLFGQKIALDGTQVTYHKVDTNNKMFGPVNPFNGTLNIEFFASFFTDSNGICYRDNYADLSCNGFSYASVTGANLRFGRFTLDSTYGPETDSIQVPFKVEYYQDNQWLVNTLDNSTSIEFNESTAQLILSPVGGVDIRDQINNVVSDGLMLLGEADKIFDLVLNAPNTQGELTMQLNPLVSPNSWTSYLNYDWNGDGVICNQASCVDSPDDADSDPQITDYPNATINFGLFRGNERIIQWREVFN
ncbi:DUF6701 domain-containing protein [Paraglaciecola sp.]|uniref:DUF6701 domain-containing protein n=1 Tax=Paraglaciecola sp. TaxID=1920173 RepID=UPI003EF7E248